MESIIVLEQPKQIFLDDQVGLVFLLFYLIKCCVLLKVGSAWKLQNHSHYFTRGLLPECKGGITYSKNMK